MINSSQKVKPYPFDSLPKVSRASAKLLETLYEVLPQFGTMSEFHSQLEAFISANLGMEAKLSLQEASTFPFQELFDKHISDQSLFAFLSLSPAKGRVVLEMDSLVSSICIDQLMGGSGDVQITRPLNKKATQIDQGVVSYFLSKILSHLYDWSGESARLHFRLEDLTSDTSQLDRLFEKKEECPALLFKISFGDKAGFVRIIFPASIIQKLKYKISSSISERERLFFQEKIEQFDFLSTELWGEAGTVQLKVGDINQLEKGDIVLLDDSKIKITPEKTVEGEVLVRAGQGNRVAFPSTVISGRVGGKKITLRLEKTEMVSQ